MIVVQGKSSTGTPHSIGIEQTPEGVKLIVLGADGKKRHASILLTDPNAHLAGGLMQHMTDRS